MHSGGLELTKLTYTRLEDNLIHHLGDRLRHSLGSAHAHAVMDQVNSSRFTTISNDHTMTYCLFREQTKDNVVYCVSCGV